MQQCSIRHHRHQREQFSFCSISLSFSLLSASPRVVVFQVVQTGKFKVLDPITGYSVAWVLRQIGLQNRHAGCYCSRRLAVKRMVTKQKLALVNAEEWYLIENGYNKCQSSSCRGLQFKCCWSGEAEVAASSRSVVRFSCSLCRSPFATDTQRAGTSVGEAMSKGTTSRLAFFI